MPDRPPAFWIILSAGFLIRLALLLTLPLYPEENSLPGYNDEPLHLAYVKHINEHWSWPVWTQTASDSTNLVDEYPQPPLYYLLAAPLYRLSQVISADAGLIGARITSLICGMITLYLIYTVGYIATLNVQTALAAVGFAAFSPNTVIFSSLVTNDALLMLLSALVFIMLFDQLVNKDSVGRAGIAIGLAIWAKMSALTLLPLVFLWGREQPKRTKWQARKRVLFFAGLIATPLILWNFIHYGQVVPTLSIYTPEESGAIRDGGWLRPLMSLTYLARTASQPMQQIWGTSPEKLSSLLWVTGLGAALWVGMLGLFSLKNKSLIIWGILLPFTALMIYNIRYYQIEARLLLPALAPLSILVALGSVKLRVPLIVQCLFWLMPLVLFVFEAFIVDAS